MNPVLNRPAIKAQAKSFIGENTRWGKMILATLPVLILSNFTVILSYIPDFSDSLDYNANEVLSNGLSIVSLIMLPFTVATAGYYLNHIRGFSPEWKSLYKEGFDNYGKYFATAFLTELFIGLWSLLFVIPGIVMGLAYSQTLYIIHDNPNLKPTEAIKMSKLMTYGFKGDIFVMGLSFIGWYLLMGLTGGILGIYVIPYVSTTSAMYYENLKYHAIEQKIIAPEAFGIYPAPGGYDPSGDANFYTPGSAYTQNQNSGYPGAAPEDGYTNFESGAEPASRQPEAAEKEPEQSGNELPSDNEVKESDASAQSAETAENAAESTENTENTASAAEESEEAVNDKETNNGSDTL